MKKSTSDITLSEVLDKYNYDPISGNFYYKYSIPQCKIKAGDIAGTENGKGYIKLSFSGYRSRISAHRVAWLVVYGTLPENEIDHIDGNKSNNAISNLRDCIREENTRNVRRYKNNSTGVKGVSYRKDRGIYTVQIQKDNKMYRKDFKTLDAAAEYANQMRTELHGEFARYE